MRRQQKQRFFTTHYALRTPHFSPRTPHSPHAGFTLIEAAVATTLVGLGISALVVSIQAGTRSNQAGRQLTQATYLAQNIREWVLKLPWKDPQTPNAPPGPDAGDAAPDDIDDLMNVALPAVDGDGQPITDLPDWSQQVSMTWKDPNSLKTGSVAPGASDHVRVTVTIRFRGQDVLTTGWLSARRTME